MKPKIETEWTNECVVKVISGELMIENIELVCFGVDEQFMTGGPVLRGPWGSISGMQSEWARYEAECKRLNAAFIQGFLRGRFYGACRDRNECTARDGENYCKLCGATVVIDNRGIL
jgi:hypothetical protein